MTLIYCEVILLPFAVSKYEVGGLNFNKIVYQKVGITNGNTFI